MASPSSQPSSKIFALPSELLEVTLVLTAASGFPAAIAAFGRTCRHFHCLVYRSDDHHLWRQVFLTTFDDPRPVLRRLRNATLTGPSGYWDCEADVTIDWVGEFMRRMNAARMFRKHVELTSRDIDMFSDTQEIEGIPFTLTKALETIISVLETSAPFPSHRTECSTIRLQSFPPIVTLLHTSTFPNDFQSLNTAWVDGVLKYGYPPALVKRYLFAGHRPSIPLKACEDTAWGSSEEGRLFHKLVFLKGFIPAPSPPPEENEPVWYSYTAARLQGVREVARSRVYNLRYLRPERCWGPFLPADGAVLDPAGNGKAPGATFPDFEQELSRYMLNVGDLVDEASSTSDASYGDEDYVPDGEEEDEEEEELGITFGRRRLNPKFVGPQPHEMFPDYTFLAAARLLVETNLREHLMVDEADQTGDAQTGGSGSAYQLVDMLACLDLGRMGGVYGFWEDSWVMERGLSEDADTGSGPAVNGSPSQDLKGKGKAKAEEFEGVEGWDWAGVAGRWIRVICWLDYHDLLQVHNLHGYTGHDLGETMRVFPMTLRVSGYSKPPDPSPLEQSSREVDSLMWKLPVIHVEGESKGSETGNDPQVVRRIKGTVRMVGDGAIRWSMTSSYPDENVPEWSTEGVQIGSIGSAIGMLGMWTGADHSSTDPLGPAWAWKIT